MIVNVEELIVGSSASSRRAAVHSRFPTRARDLVLRVYLALMTPSLAVTPGRGEAVATLTAIALLLAEGELSRVYLGVDHLGDVADARGLLGVASAPLVRGIAS